VVLHFSVRFGSSAGSLTSTLNVQKSKFSQNFLQKPLLNEYNLEDILQNPSEVWATYDFDSKNTPESLHVFKFYKLDPVVLNIELVKNNWVAQTIFINNKNDYATFKKRRKGLLIAKKQE
jgi:hypothetical protein